MALVTMTLVMAAGIGAAAAGSDVMTPMIGTAVLGLYAAALAGVGLVVGGLVKPSIASATVGAFVSLTFLLNMVAPGFKLPSWVDQLVLTSHLGAADGRAMGLGRRAYLPRARVRRVGSVGLGFGATRHCRVTYDGVERPRNTVGLLSTSVKEGL